MVLSVRFAVEQRAADDVGGVHGTEEGVGLFFLFAAAGVDLDNQGPEQAGVASVARSRAEGDDRAYSKRYNIL